jgi:endonuclease YncB( thermonuclease family)
VRAVVLMSLAFALGLGAGYALGVWRSPPPKLPPRALDLNIVDGGTYRVRAVVDGDTVTLENGLHVRYHGINAPESGRWVQDAAPLAAEATARNIALVEGKRVRLRLGRDPFDIHGRIIARVYVVPDGANGADETEAGAVLVKEGLAKAMAFGVTPDEAREMKVLEDAAKTAKMGIWGLEGHAAVEKPYCAADKTGIYHLSTCSTAKRISPANLHQYATREEAEAVGLKPCSRCLPK